MTEAPETGTRAVVVDASLVAMWVLSEQYSPAALALASHWARLELQVIAPPFMMAEVSSALYKRVRRGELSLEQGLEALEIALGFGVRTEGEVALSRRALELASRFDRPTPYDAHYLALAELHSCEVWTGDERLYNAVRLQLPWVRWIGSYAPSDR